MICSSVRHRSCEQQFDDCTLATNGWSVTFGSAKRGVGHRVGGHSTYSPLCCTKCNSPPIKGYSTNFVLSVIRHKCGRQL